MQYIAVYDQYRQLQAARFGSLIEATDFLFLGYEDRLLFPYGVYDSHTDQVQMYTHAGQSLIDLVPEAVRTSALFYLKEFELPG